ncbi:hypothetical protein [Aeromonas veronii]|nr:hypothetical protein [Aeromonas veronii]
MATKSIGELTQDEFLRILGQTKVVQEMAAVQMWAGRPETAV